MESEPRLCPTIEGVQFSFGDGGERVRGLVLREALEAYFGAGQPPDSWLQAYAGHAESIQAVALREYRRQPHKPLVVLRPEHFADPASAAGGAA